MIFQIMNGSILTTPDNYYVLSDICQLISGSDIRETSGDLIANTSCQNVFTEPETQIFFQLNMEFLAPQVCHHDTPFS